MRSQAPEPGTVIQIALPDGRYAYGRVLRDASVAFYSSRSDRPGCPPIGAREYEFVVGVYEDVLRTEGVPAVGMDASADPDDEWPPPYSVRDVLTGRSRIYHRGKMEPATEEQVRDLEPAAVWDWHHLVERLMASGK
ncbi:hypothetical protein [Isoptericola sp. NPDC055881]